MSNLAKLEFMALDITGKNYLSWALDAEIHLNANNLGDTIKEGNKTSTQDKAKAMIFLRHHIHESLKNEYLTIKDPLVLWTNLKERYDHQKTVILPRARYEWINLRLQDFKSISEYNSAMFRITSQLILCGENITDKEMLEKTFSTFHASNIVLQQQYRERGFTKYSDLISCLLVAEQNNELLMKNHETRPVGTTPFPEVNVATYNDQSGSHGRGRGYQRGRGHGRSRGRGHGRGRGRAYGRGNYHNVQFKNRRTHQKLHDNEKKSTDERGKKKSGTSSNACYRCGGNNHWAGTCRTARHLVELYQQSIKDKQKGIETNFTYEDGNVDVPSGEKDHSNATNLDHDDFLIEQANLDSGDIMADTNQLDACNFPYA
ncbi:uncharacterized protein LOC110914003 [Helianthus annuus]|uniref:uncharacterized protein LOC110914003 n=1 Tax=Helianthus annuus TaxID=4232 RepID=UPI000B8F4793|nr:uncharacterized protein LOC110914003 [Helianthus annuus]